MTLCTRNQVIKRLFTVKLIAHRARTTLTRLLCVQFVREIRNVVKAENHYKVSGSLFSRKYRGRPGGVRSSRTQDARQNDGRGEGVVIGLRTRPRDTCGHLLTPDTGRKYLRARGTWSSPRDSTWEKRADDRFLSIERDGVMRTA